MATFAEGEITGPVPQFSFLDDLLMGATGATSLMGLVRSIFAGGAEQRARQERERQLTNMERGGLSDYYSGLGQDRNTLMGAAGAGADAVRALGANTGAALAAGGVYNPSTVAGATSDATRQEQASLAYLSNQLQQQRNQQLSQNRQQVAGQRLGYANQDIQRAQDERAAGTQGFLSYLGALSQYNNKKTGVTAQQRGLPPINGTQGKLDYFAGTAPPTLQQFSTGIAPTLTPTMQGVNFRPQVSGIQRYQDLRSNNVTPGFFTGGR